MVDCRHSLHRTSVCRYSDIGAPLLGERGLGLCTTLRGSRSLSDRQNPCTIPSQEVDEKRLPRSIKFYSDMASWKRTSLADVLVMEFSLVRGIVAIVRKLRLVLRYATSRGASKVRQRRWGLALQRPANVDRKMPLASLREVGTCRVSDDLKVKQ